MAQNPIEPMEVVMLPQKGGIIFYIRNHELFAAHFKDKPLAPFEWRSPVCGGSVLAFTAWGDADSTVHCLVRSKLDEFRYFTSTDAGRTFKQITR